jgi:glycogen synthase
MADPARFRGIQANGMARDHSWRVPAAAYEAAYRRAISGR